MSPRANPAILIGDTERLFRQAAQVPPASKAVVVMNQPFVMDAPGWQVIRRANAPAGKGRL